MQIMPLTRSMKVLGTIFLSISICQILLPITSLKAEECATPIISGPPAWPPFVFPKNDTGERWGVAIDISQQVFTSIGAKNSVDTIKPWKRVLRDLEQGKIDLIFALLVSKERRDKYIYTDAWAYDTYGVVTLKGKEFKYSSVEDLRNHSGAYYADLRIPKPLNQVFEQGKNFQSIKDVASLYKVLHQGRVDYLIVSVPSFVWFIPDQYRKNDFSVIKESLVTLPVYMALSRKSPCAQFIDEINVELRARKKIIEEMFELNNKD